MKRLLCCALALLMMVGVFAGCGEKTDDTAKETFTVGFDAAFPPYGYVAEDGSYVGFDLDLAAEVAKRNNWELVLKPIDWDAKDMELDSGAIDCIWNGFTVTGREEDYTWTAPYVDNSQVVVVKKDSGITTLADLAGKTVLVQADSTALASLTSTEDNDKNLALAATFAALNQVPEYNTAFMTLEAGGADAIAMDVGVANYQIANRGDKFVILEESLATEQYAVGFKKGNTELRDKVEATMKEMSEDGTFDKIVADWADKGLSADAICFGK